MQTLYQRFEHTTTTEIVLLLSQVTRSQAPLLIRAGAETFSATISSVHLPQSYLLLTCDDAMRCLACANESESVHFSTQLDWGRLEFTVRGRSVRTYDHTMLWVDLPTQLLRIDRRAHRRNVLPQDSAASCELPGRNRILRVRDISMGGVGLASSDPEEKFAVGEIFRDSRICLPGAEAFRVNLEVRCLSETAKPGQGRQLHLGCHFLSLPRAYEELVRRFAA